MLHANRIPVNDTRSRLHPVFDFLLRPFRSSAPVVEHAPARGGQNLDALDAAADIEADGAYDRWCEEVGRDELDEFQIDFCSARDEARRLGYPLFLISRSDASSYVAAPTQSTAINGLLDVGWLKEGEAFQCQRCNDDGIPLKPVAA